MQGSFFKAFGLNIESEIPLAEFIRGEPAADVFVRSGSVSPVLDDSVPGGILCQINQRRILLNIDHVGRYLISDGAEIIVDPADDSDPDSIRLFLTGSAFGALLHQRNVIPLHGSAVLTKKGAVILSGDSGSGKSVLAAALHRRGYPVLADDLCAIHSSDPVMLAPGAPCLLLWADALRCLRMDRPALRPVRPQMQKYIVGLDDGVGSDSVPLHAVYILECSNYGLSGPIPLTGLPKIEALIQCTYRPLLVTRMGREGSHMRLIAEAARRIVVRRVNRPAGVDTIEALADLIEQDLSQ